jgi:hypothetical protein
MIKPDKIMFTVLRVDYSDPGRPTETPIDQVQGEKNAEARLEQLRQKLTLEEINKGITYRVTR